MTYFYNLHNIIRLKSDLDMKLNYFQCEEFPQEADLIIRIVPYRPVDKEKYQRIAPGLYYFEAENSIVSNVNIMGLKISWEVRNVLSPSTELRASKSYVTLSKYILTFPISSVYKLITWIRIVIQIKLLLKNHSFLVGGCANLNDKNIIFAGLVGSGKTLSIVHFIERYGADFMSDDTVIINKASLYGFPTLLKLRKFNFDFGSFSTYVDPVNKFGRKIKDQSKGNCDLYFLELSMTQFVRRISTAEGINKLCNLNDKIFLCSNERILSSLSYVYEELAFLNLQNKQRDIITAFFKNANFYTICAKNTSDYIELIKDKY